MPLKTLPVNFILVSVLQISKYFYIYAKECMCFPNWIGSSFTGVFHAQSMFDFFITFPYGVFAIEGGTTRGNAWDDVSFALGIVMLTSFLLHALCNVLSG